MRYQFTCPVCQKTVTKTRVLASCSYACRSALRRARTVTAATNDDGLTARIPLRNNGGSVKAYVLIDTADAAWAQRYRWMLSADGYAFRREPHQSTILMHREILGLVPGDGIEGDHINRNRLDNRRENLRAVPKHGNRQNQSCQRGSASKYRGVSWAALQQKWRARIHVNGKSLHLGLFDSEEEAGAVAKTARLQHMPYAVD